MCIQIIIFHRPRSILIRPFFIIIVFFINLLTLITPHSQDGLNHRMFQNITRHPGFFPGLKCTHGKCSSPIIMTVRNEGIWTDLRPVSVIPVSVIPVLARFGSNWASNEQSLQEMGRSRLYKQSNICQEKYLFTRT